MDRTTGSLHSAFPPGMYLLEWMYQGWAGARRSRRLYLDASLAEVEVQEHAPVQVRQLLGHVLLVELEPLLQRQLLRTSPNPIPVPIPS